MLEEVLNDSSSSLFPPLKTVAKKKVTTTKARKADYNLVSKWNDWADELLSQFPPKFHPDLINYGVDFGIEAIMKDGLIVAQYQAEDERYRLFVDLKPKSKQPWGCECFDSLGSKPCIHSFTLTDWLNEMLQHFDHEVTHLIATGQFHKQRPELASLSQVDDEMLGRYLDQKLPKFQAAVTSDPAELGAVSDAVPTRICWELTGSNTNPHLYLRLQQPKKRGGGWTKGKRLTSTNFYRHLHLASEADRKVFQQLTSETFYYTRELVFDPVEALQHLVGQSNVMFEGKPVEVVRFSPELEFYQTDQHCGVRQKAEPNGLSDRTLLGSGNQLLEICPSAGQLRVATATEGSVAAIKTLMLLPPLPKAGAEELIERLKGYQDVLAIDLSATGQDVEPEQTQPALLLRSRKDGKLDYGFRLRGSHGNLYLPATGAGLIKAQSKQPEKTITLKRDFNREIAQTDQLANQLQLPAQPLEGTVDDFSQSLEMLETAQQLESEGGIEVLWDKQSVEPLRVLGTVTAKALRVEVGAARDWFQLKGKCELTNGSIDLSDLLSGVANDETSGSFIRFGKQGWAKVSKKLRSQLNRMADTLSRDRKKLSFDASAVPALQQFLQDDIQVKAAKKWKECLARIEQSKALVPVVPKSLNAELREYQTEGFNWLRRLAEWGVGGILADDMGLGKTLQTLAVLLDRAAGGPALVVAPTSVGFNWKSESERFAADLKVHLYRETDRDEFLENLGPHDLVICSYGLLLRDINKLSKIHWSTLVLDEAQAIKNNRSKTATAAKKIEADWKLALTGTPMENHLGELWSIFNVVAPGVFGGWENFRTRFAKPIERDQDDERRAALRDRIQPFVLRRTKSEVLKDLPPRTEQNISIELSPEERAVYDRVRLSAIGEIDEIANLSDVQDQRFRVLALLTRLRQLACSPKLVHEDWNGRSSKLQQLAETVGSLKAEGHRVLIFSQFVKHLSLIRAMLTEEEISFEYLDGSTKASARQESVNRFQHGDATAFLISLKAGGTGLNLTAADYVIHMDPWWNPAVEDQATDRAHRIGQQRPVMCYRFVAQGTIEEEILKLHDTKRDLVTGVLEGSSSAAKMTTADLIELIRR